MANNGVFYSGGTGGTGLDLTSGGVTRINVSTGGVITFNNDYSFPTADGGANEVLITNGSGNVSFNTIPNASLDNSSFTLGSTSISLGDTASSIAGLTSITADTVYANSVLRISQNGDGLRMTNVGAFDNDGSNNFRIFSNNDLILSTNGDSGTAVTFDSSSKDATFQGQVIGSFNGSGANLNSIPNSSLDNSSLTVTAGSGLANGGSVSLGGSVTLNVGVGTGIVVNANDVALDYSGTNNFIDSATNLEGTSIATSDTIIYHDATDNNVKKGLISDLPFSNNSGTVTSVTVGTGLDVSNGTTTPNITLDLSELATSTTNGDGDFFVVVDSSNVQRKLTKGNINISGFNNDAGFTTNTGTVTSVAISGTDGIDVDSGSPITTSGTITLGLSNVPNSSLANSSLTVTAGSGLANGGLVSLGGSVTLNVGAGTGIVVNANDVALDYTGTNNFIDSATNLEGTGIALGDTIVYHDATDNNVKKGFVSDLPFTNTSGTVTNVTVGTGLDVTNGTTTPNITLDLSELPTSTTNGDGDYFVVVDTSNVQRKLTKANINISGFNNDAGYITSAGNTNIYSTDGLLTSNRFLNQNGYILEFQSVGEEYFQVYNNNNVPVRSPRVRMEADDPYTTVLELQSSNPGVFLIDGYDGGNSQIFNVDGNGNLFATSKSFLIEHPSKPEFNLRHGSLEGPEHGVYVRGKLDGNNVIELPDYWIDLVDESTITVQLTPIGSHQNLYVKDIFENMVVVNNSALLSSKIKCFYFIQAERKDIDKMVVEYPKGTQSI